MGEETEGHLRAAGVVGAQEQHRGLVSVIVPSTFANARQPLPGEAFGQQRQEVGDGGPTGELVVGGVQEPLDGFHAEHVGELGRQPGGRGP